MTIVGDGSVGSGEVKCFGEKFFGDWGVEVTYIKTYEWEVFFVV